MAEETSVSVRVDAPAEKVYELFSDLSRMGEWSPECTRVEWRGGAAQAAVGAKFKGHNQRGARKWSTNGTVVALDPGREMAFDISSFGLPVARWAYRVTPEGDDACTLTETWTDRRGFIVNVGGRILTGVKERKTHNADGMQETLQRIKAAAER
jgi:uncharacterized protein YndB with AHSA1/START domain